MQVSPDGYPFTMYFNFDIPFIGIFVLGYSTELLRSGVVIGGIAAAFAILHIFFVPHLSYLIMAFMAAVLYGSAYYFTGAIEAAILAHFVLNVTQFFLFTYPALK